MNFVADALLAAGGRPMMTETQAEAPLVVTGADSLLVNLGTLSTDGLAGIPPTVGAARAAGMPWVLDPAAIGRAPVRTTLARALLASKPAVVRANASEVLVLAGQGRAGRGPDSTAQSQEAAAAARDLAADTGVVFSISGATDIITDGSRIAMLDNGTPLLTQVTGTGCALGALTAACCVVADPWTAAVAAAAWLSVAGERAAETSLGPGSFKVALIDALAAVSGGDLETSARLS